MIAYKRTRINTKSDIHEIKKSTKSGITRGKNIRIKREKLQLLAKRTITRTAEQYKKMAKSLDVQIQDRQKRPNECV